jgi:hypothetical protein
MSPFSLASALAAPAAAADDIRDIRGPLAIPEWSRWPLAIAICGLAALAVVLVVRWWRARRMRSMTPYERALAALRVAETHAREGRSHEWADVVAETLRGALSVRLGSEVLPKTTSELARTAWAHWTYQGPVERERAAPAPALLDAPHLIELLEVCDLARFAMASLDTRALLEWTAFARDALEHLFAPALTASSPPLSPQSV